MVKRPYQDLWTCDSRKDISSVVVPPNKNKLQLRTKQLIGNVEKTNNETQKVGKFQGHNSQNVLERSQSVPSGETDQCIKAFTIGYSALY